MRARALLIAALAAAPMSPALPAGAAAGPTISTIAGGVPDGLPATSVALMPSDVDATSTGDLYITDVGSGVIWRRSPDGRLHHVAGSGKLCVPDPTACYGDGGPAREAFLHAPAAVLVAPNGDIYVAEQRANRVRRIDAATGTIHPFAGNGSQDHDDAAMGGPAAEAAIPLPIELVMDSQGNLYIASPYQRIYKVTPEGTITVAAGCGGQRFPVCWQGQDGAPVEGTMVGTNAGINGNGWGMAVAPNDDLYLMDWGRVLRLDMDEQVYRVISGGLADYASIPGQGENGPASDARFSVTVAMAFSPAGDLYLMDGGGGAGGPFNRIQKIEAPAAPSSIIRHVGGNGIGNGYSGDGGPAKQARFAFSQPTETWTGQGMDVGPDGTVYVADVHNNRVRAITPDGIVTTVAGNGHGGAAPYRANNNDLLPVTGVATGLTTRGGFSGDGGPASDAQLYAPADVESDQHGNLYVLDRYANRVRRVDADTGVITTVAGTGCVGVRCPTPVLEEGRPATNTSLNFPVDISLDRTGTQLYIAERGWRRVRQVNLGKKAFEAYPLGPRPVRIQPGHIATVLGEGVNVPTPGAPWGPNYLGCGLLKPYCGDGLTWDMWSPGELQGTATDSAGNLYAADARSNQVVRVDAATGLVELIAGTPHTSDCLGDADDGLPGRLTQLCGPTALLVTPDDSKLYIVESSRSGDVSGLVGGAFPAASRIRAVNLATPAFVSSVVAGNGNSGFGGDGGPAVDAQLGVPHAITLGPDGSLYVADTGNHRIRRIAPSGVITTVAGSGTYTDNQNHDGCGFAGDGGVAAAAMLCAPLGLDMGPDGTLYVADALNNAIRAIEGL